MEVGCHEELAKSPKSPTSPDTPGQRVSQDRWDILSSPMTTSKKNQPANNWGSIYWGAGVGAMERQQITCNSISPLNDICCILTINEPSLLRKPWPLKLSMSTKEHIHHPSLPALFPLVQTKNLYFVLDSLAVFISLYAACHQVWSILPS